MLKITSQTTNSATSIPRERIYYLDHLKILLVCLVIAHHASQAYGPTGGEWVYHSGIKANWLGNFMAVNASFFMGLFFMISGYFLPRSFEGKKFSVFIKRKLKHLMLPVLLIMIIIVPIYFYLAYNFNTLNKVNFFDYYINTYLKTDLISYEHGWYLVNLFMYSLVYALVMILLKNRKLKLLQNFKVWYIFLLALLVAVISIIMRFEYPIDRWIDLLGFIGMEPAHLPQYALFFTFGILAYNNHYFEDISKKIGHVFLSIGLFMALIIYFGNFGFMQQVIKIVWESWAFYESFMAIFISIGLIVFFREHLNKSNIFMKNLAQNAFGVYVVHNFFVVLFQLSLDGVSVNASLKFIFVSALSITTSFLAVFFLRKINMIKKII